MDPLDAVCTKFLDGVNFCLGYFDTPLIIFISVAAVVLMSMALIHRKA